MVRQEAAMLPVWCYQEAETLCFHHFFCSGEASLCPERPFLRFCCESCAARWLGCGCRGNGAGWRGWRTPDASPGAADCNGGKRPWAWPGLGEPRPSSWAGVNRDAGGPFCRRVFSLSAGLQSALPGCCCCSCCASGAQAARVAQPLREDGGGACTLHEGLSSPGRAVPAAPFPQKGTPLPFPQRPPAAAGLEPEKDKPATGLWPGQRPRAAPGQPQVTLSPRGDPVTEGWPCWHVPLKGETVPRGVGASAWVSCSLGSAERSPEQPGLCFRHWFRTFPRSPSDTSGQRALGTELGCFPQGPPRWATPGAGTWRPALRQASTWGWGAGGAALEPPASKANELQRSDSCRRSGSRPELGRDPRRRSRHPPWGSLSGG